MLSDSETSLPLESVGRKGIPRCARNDKFRDPDLNE